MKVKRLMKKDKPVYGKELGRVVELMHRYPAIWDVLNDLAKNRGEVYQSQLKISHKWARKMEELMEQYGIITISTIVGEGKRGFRKYLTLTDYGRRIVETLGLPE